MVRRTIKIPKHGGPDGQGLPRNAFEQLYAVIEDLTLTDEEVKLAIELCLAVSTQKQWNDEYRQDLIKRIE